jgi:2-iminobutanoate/2-iminopropanoate deaminase
VRGIITAVVVTVAGLGVTVQGQSRQVFPGAGTLPFSLATKADGLIYIAGTLAQEGDIKVQTKKVLDDMSQALTKAGSSLANVAAVHVYVKNAADVAGMTEVWRTSWPKDPPARTTVITELVRPNALVEMSMVAVPTGSERVVITPAGWTTANPYSYAIRSGDSLFMSGMISRSVKDNSPIEGDMSAQTKTVMANAAELLKAAGFGFEHVVASRVFITDGTKFQDMNAAYVPNFPKDPPARATVIAGLPGAPYQVEITMTANRRPKQAFTTPAADGTPGKPSATLSSAIKVGNRLYVAGLLGNTPANKGNVEAQTKELLARVGRTLTAAGFGWGDLVDGIVYITDLNNFEGMNAGYRSVISKDFPARATVKAGLVGADGLVEIMFVASK